MKTQEEYYSAIHDQVDSREKFISLLVDSFDNPGIGQTERNAIKEYAMNNEKWWNENE